MATKKLSDRPKQVVYLIGAGATQAEVTYLGAKSINLLMRDAGSLEGVATRILNRLGKRWRQFLGDNQGADIEKLISLLSAGGVDDLVTLAEDIRRHYFLDIRKNLLAAGIATRPELAIGLLEMHNNVHFRRHVEVLSGILTTNHDGLFQVASHEVFSEVNLGFPFESSDFNPNANGDIPPILQLHGSFTWKFGVPINVARLRRSLPYTKDTTWIPPTTLKDPKQYPFNKVVALAYELLSKKCDVLRVIGSSLTQNDWNILSLIFNAQRHRELERKWPFRIDLIMSRQTGERIQRECSYLKDMFTVAHLTEGKFHLYKEDVIPSDMQNVFAYWLKEKISYHQSKKNFGGSSLGGLMSKIAGGL